MTRPYVKSYGRWDPSWDAGRIRDMLEDAAGIAVSHGEPLCIHEDREGSLALIPYTIRRPPYILVCKIGAAGNSGDPEGAGLPRVEFRDHEHEVRTIDGMVPIVRDCLSRGVVHYGDLEFLSGGRMQLAQVMQDAAKMVEKYSVQFIAGESKKGGIMISPLSEKPHFVAPLAWIVTRYGFWSVSDMHSDRIWTPKRDTVTIEEIERLLGGAETCYSMARSGGTYNGPLYMLYEAIGYGRKHYGGLGGSRDWCISRLESAFEDAARMPVRDGMCRLGMNSNGEITVDSKGGELRPDSDDVFLEVDPDEFLSGDKLLTARISAAARDAYGMFCPS